MSKKEEELTEIVANIAYLYSKKRLENTYFFQQDRTDLEYLLNVLKKHGYKDSIYGFVKLDDLISKLDKNGELPLKK